jgi:hypothetical protein
VLTTKIQDFKRNVIKPIKSQEKIGREKFEVMRAIMCIDYVNRDDNHVEMRNVRSKIKNRISENFYFVSSL